MSTPADSTPEPGAETRTVRRRVAPQLLFGVAAATLEIAIVLYFMYC